MPSYNTQAINLKSYNLGESDKIVVMYSRDYGLIRCVAKGVKKASSKLGGRMQNLIANNLQLAKGKNLDIVCQAELVESFNKTKNDMTKLVYSFYCAELISILGIENDSNSPVIYDAFFESLKNISIFSELEEILWTVIRFKLKLMHYLGYSVELENCVCCNEQENKFSCYHFFCSTSGGVICSDCSPKFYKSSEIDKRHLSLLQDAIKYDFPVDNKQYDKNLLYSCFNILKDYVTQRSDKKLKTPEMIEALC